MKTSIMTNYLATRLMLYPKGQRNHDARLNHKNEFNWGSYFVPVDEDKLGKISRCGLYCLTLVVLGTLSCWTFRTCALWFSGKM